MREVLLILCNMLWISVKFNIDEKEVIRTHKKEKDTKREEEIVVVDKRNEIYQ